VLVSIDNHGEASLQGIRIGHDATTVGFAGEPWPPEVAAQREMARRVLRRLVGAR
jgi:hypothetical protein